MGAADDAIGMITGSNGPPPTRNPEPIVPTHPRMKYRKIMIIIRFESFSEGRGHRQGLGHSAQGTPFDADGASGCFLHQIEEFPDDRVLRFQIIYSW